jgi:hypothetical protein
MSILSNLPATLTCGTPVVVTIDKAQFVTAFSITDPFWSNPANWQEIQFYYVDDTGISQIKKMSFAGTTYSLDLPVSIYNGIMQCQKITLISNNATLEFLRASFPTANAFDFAVAGGFPPLTGSAFSPAHKAALLNLSNSDLTITGNTPTQFSWAEMADYIDASVAGKYYVEFLADLVTGNGDTVGLSFLNADPTQYQNTPVGFPTIAFGGEGGGQGGATAFSHTAGVYVGGASTANNNIGYGPTWTTGDVIMMAIDVTNKKIWFGKNGAWIFSGATAGFDPATNAGGLSISAELGATARIYPHAGVNFNDVVTKVSAPTYTPVGFTNF